MNLPRTLCASLALLIAGSAVAETVYRHVDPEGRVTYSSEPPESAKGTTKEIEVDTDRNVIAPESNPQLERLESEERMRYYQRKQNEENAKQDREAQIAEAEARLQQALDDQQAGDALQPGDLLGKQGGGTRPSQQRVERLQRLEANVEAAKENLERVRRGR